MTNLWYPFRWGLYIRKKLLKFSSSYGSTFMFLRRPLAVFIDVILDDKHQETLKGTKHYQNGKYNRRKRVKN